MKKLTKKEKNQLLKELKASGWTGCMCDKCLLILAEKVLEWQLKKNEIH